MKEADFLVVGAGIGGTSCAHWLSEQHSVIVLEMEGQPGYHTTGRSVAVYTEAYGPRTIRALAKSGYGFLTSPPPGFSDIPLSRPQGLFFIARDDQMAALESGLADVQELSPEIRMISASDAVRQIPVLREDYLAGAFLDPSALALDVNAIHQGYIRGIRRNGGEIVCGAGVTGLERKGGKWHATTSAGEFAAPVIINAAGAWADELGQMVGATRIGLQPKRRTVIAFVPPNCEVSSEWPVVIDCQEEFYFKVDAGTVLGSPADETPVEPQDVQPEEIDIAYTIDRLEKATTMKVERLERKWAGLRSFVPDGIPVSGYDPNTEGFCWCAGQGGYGIETSIGMGRSTAALAAGNSIPDDIQQLGVTPDLLSPERF
ncbi:MAG: FAD-binding oxidoreductase [Pseudomonadota bacterium]